MTKILRLLGVSGLVGVLGLVLVVVADHGWTSVKALTTSASDSSPPCYNVIGPAPTNLVRFDRHQSVAKPGSQAPANSALAALLDPTASTISFVSLEVDMALVDSPSKQSTVEEATAPPPEISGSPTFLVRSVSLSFLDQAGRVRELWTSTNTPLTISIDEGVNAPVSIELAQSNTIPADLPNVAPSSLASDSVSQTEPIGWALLVAFAAILYTEWGHFRLIPGVSGSGTPTQPSFGRFGHRRITERLIKPIRTHLRRNRAE